MGERHVRVLRLRRYARGHGAWLHLSRQLNAPPVAVVNQEFVKLFGNRNPIGHRFGFSGPGMAGMDGAHEIVGVVENTTYTSIHWKTTPCIFCR